MPVITGSFSSPELAKAVVDNSEQYAERFKQAFLVALASLRGLEAVNKVIENIDRGIAMIEKSDEITGMGDSVSDAIENVSVDPESMLEAQWESLISAGSVTADEVGLGISFDITNPRAIQAAQNIGIFLVTYVNDSVRASIRDIIQDQVSGLIGRAEAHRLIKQRVGLLPNHALAVQNLEASLTTSGMLSPALVANRVQAYAARLLKYRADMISRTEVARATSVGQHEYWEQAADAGLLPPNTLRKWIVTRDERLCDICEPMTDSDAIPLDGYWELDNGEQVFYPTDSHPSCRCTTGLVFPDLVGKVDPLGWERWIAIRPIQKHANHDQKSHGNWATGGVIQRGFPVEEWWYEDADPSLRRLGRQKRLSVMNRIADGEASADDLLGIIAPGGTNVGIWWGTSDGFGDDDIKAYALGSAGEWEENLELWRSAGKWEGDNPIYGSFGVVLIADAPAGFAEAVEEREMNFSGSGLGGNESHYLEPGAKVHLTEIRYTPDGGKTWYVAPADHWVEGTPSSVSKHQTPGHGPDDQKVHGSWARGGQQRLFNRRASKYPGVTELIEGLYGSRNPDHTLALKQRTSGMPDALASINTNEEKLLDAYPEVGRTIVDGLDQWVGNLIGVGKTRDYMRAGWEKLKGTVRLSRNEDQALGFLEALKNIQIPAPTLYRGMAESSVLNAGVDLRRVNVGDTLSHQMVSWSVPSRTLPSPSPSTGLTKKVNRERTPLVAWRMSVTTKSWVTNHSSS